MNKKIIIMGPYPSSENEKDGMIQRIKAIDEILSDNKRLYITLDQRAGVLPAVENISANCSVFKANLFIYFIPVWIYILISNSVLYCHSVIEATKALGPILLGKKHFIDLHGVVPEEMEYAGRARLSSLFGFTEKIVMSRAALIIVVTKKMMSHLSEKYPLHGRDVLYLPIFQSSAARGCIEQRTAARAVAVYAGGIQPWQNIEKMLQLACDNKEIDFIFLVSNSDAFKAKYRDFIINCNNLTIDSVPHAGVQTYYRQADFGLVLRDDIIVNRVACPTKLVEYIEAGLIPIIGDCNIGDFVEDGMAFSRFTDFNYSFIRQCDFLAMNKNNALVVQAMIQSRIIGSQKLRQYFVS